MIAESSAAGIMLAASFFSLLSPAFEYPCAIPPYVAVTLGFCIGGGVIILTDRLFARSARMSEKGDRKSRLLYAAVTLHNIPEGMAVGVAFAGGGFLPALMLALGIGVQNVPEGLCVACPLRARGMSRKKSFFSPRFRVRWKFPRRCLAPWLRRLFPA
ncbi:MAG: ZIP family metal transporter [Christensenellaceae bacterium]